MSGDVPFSIVCLSPQEWTAPLPTNRQQIMRRAAAHGHDVLFVETSDFFARQVVRRRTLGVSRPVSHVATVKALNVAPWGHKVAHACRLNNAVTALRLRHLVDTLPRPVVAWVYDPCAAEIAMRLDVAFTVYDCVDDYAQQTRGDARRSALVTVADRATAAAARLVFTTSRTQERRLAAINPNTHYVPNVGDHAHFAPAADRAFASADVRDLPRPVVGFAGNMLPSKVDFDLVQRLARARPAWSFVCVGPTPEPQAVAALRAEPNVHLLGARTYEEIPRYVAAFDVGLIPYVENDYTRSCFPLKLYEYLAAGKPVVATGLPELIEMEPDVVLVRDDESVLAAIEQGLAARGSGDVSRRTAIAARNTWETRAAALLGLVAQELAA